MIFKILVSNHRKPDLTTPGIAALLLFLMLGLPSCVKYRDLVNFQEGPALDSIPRAATLIPMYRIQPDDILGISVQSFDMSVAEPFNVKSSDATGTPETGSGYLVTAEGFITLPLIGNVKMTGLTIQEAKDTLVSRLAVYIKDPIVQLRLLNFKVTVLGEVGQPATFTIPNEKINVLQALGMAGDLTNYARRDNILVIRERDGKREFGRINLKSSESFRSPYFYLTQNDVIYIEPIKAKTGSITDPYLKYGPFVATMISAIAIVASVFLK